MPSEVVVGVRENLMLLVNSYILKMAALKSSAEYNQKAAIIESFRARRSATEVIQFFSYPRSTVYDIVAKYTALEQSNESSSMPGRNSRKNAPRRFLQSLKEFDFRAIVAKISIDCWCKRANNPSNCRGGPSIQIIHIYHTTDAL